MNFSGRLCTLSIQTSQQAARNYSYRYREVKTMKNTVKHLALTVTSLLHWHPKTVGGCSSGLHPNAAK